jgi:putative flippase GtrA
MRALLAQLVRFGLVGAVGLVIDVGVFNLLRITVLAPEAVQHGPIYAKLISTSIAIVVNWLGNRYWTFGHARRPRLLREGFEFAVVSVGGMGIGLLCLWVSHYALGFTSLLADNLSSNVVGLALGTAFRFWLYRVWVFRGEPRAVHPDPQRSGSAEGPVLPSGRAPLDRIKTVAAVEDGFLRNE